MTEQAKFDAVKQNNERYDGVFFYAVKSTKVFCRPSCRSRTPKKENVLFFNSSKDAIENGFRPCKRCRPDLLLYQPDREAAETAKQLIDRFFKDKNQLLEELKRLGFSLHRIVEIFKNEYGQTPAQYADRLRINEAKRMLKSSNNEIVDIAFESGFGSLSSFYRVFKKSTQLSPAKYRREKGGK